MSRSQIEKDKALLRMLYDMCVLANAIKFLRHWRRKPRALDFGEEQFALNAAMVKLRLLYDFFYHKHDPNKPNDITADQLHPAASQSFTGLTASELEFRRSINMWCAHLSWHRIRDVSNTPKRRDALKFGTAVLSQAIPFVEVCLKSGFTLNKTGRVYWNRLKVPTA